LLGILLIACIIVSCKDDDGMQKIDLGNSSGSCDMELEDFNLTAENNVLISYDGISEVTYYNEAGIERTYKVTSESSTITEGIFAANDSLNLCYAVESITTKLLSNDGIEYTIVVESKPYFADLQSTLAADVLKIFYNDTTNEDIDRRLIFRKILDIKNYPPPLYETTILIESQYFIDEEFKLVEYTAFNSPIVKLFFNDVVGIVAYEDEGGVLWQFSEKN